MEFKQYNCGGGGGGGGIKQYNCGGGSRLSVVLLIQ